MSALDTKDPNADDIAREIVAELLTDRNQQLSGLVKTQVKEILGDFPGAGKDAGLSAFIHEQIEAGVNAKVKDLNLDEEIATLREALATKAPERAAEPVNIMDEWDPKKPNPAAVGGPLDGQFSGLKDYLRAVATLNPKFSADRDPRLTMLSHSVDVKAALTGEEIDLGGALVPEEFRSQLMMLALEPTSIRARATNIPMSSQTLSLPAIRDTDHSDGSVYGAVKFFWTESGDEIPDSQPEFSQVRLTAKLLTGLTEINNTMLMDSFTSVPALLGQMWPKGAMWSEEMAFIRGSGAGQPLGVLDAPASITGQGSTGTFTITEAATMLSHLTPESYGSACWHVHPGLLPNLVTMTQGSTSAWIVDYTLPIPYRLLGLPVVFTEHVNGMGTAGDVLLSDWRFYLIGDRQAMSMAASEHNKFPQYRTVFRSVSRLDGQPWMDAALTLRDGSFQVSPFVVRG